MVYFSIFRQPSMRAELGLQGSSTPPKYFQGDMESANLCFSFADCRRSLEKKKNTDERWLKLWSLMNSSVRITNLFSMWLTSIQPFLHSSSRLTFDKRHNLKLPLEEPSVTPRFYYDTTYKVLLFKLSARSIISMPPPGNKQLPTLQNPNRRIEPTACTGRQGQGGSENLGSYTSGLRSGWPRL